jgi:hypothetical protein
LTTEELKQLDADELWDLGFNKFNDSLILIPLWAFNYIKDGEVLYCIDGCKNIKGQDDIDLDIRFGCIAYGFKIISGK